MEAWEWVEPELNVIGAFICVECIIKKGIYAPISFEVLGQIGIVRGPTCLTLYRNMLSFELLMYGVLYITLCN